MKVTNINRENTQNRPSFKAKLISLSLFGDKPFLNRLAYQLQNYASPNDTFVLSEGKSISNAFNDVRLHFVREGSIEPGVMKSESYKIQDDQSNHKNRETIVNKLLEQYSYLKR